MRAPYWGKAMQATVDHNSWLMLIRNTDGFELQIVETCYSKMGGVSNAMAAMV